MSTLDLLLINPGGRELIYQGLGGELTAVEPPLWSRLIAGYIVDRGFSTKILDSEAENMGPESVARAVAAEAPRLVGLVVYGHQPSASTQQMAGASLVCGAIKKLNPDQKIIILGGHVAALPERTIQEEAVDFACNGEGPQTVHGLLEVLKTGGDLSAAPGLVWRESDGVHSNPAPPLIQNLDADLHGNVWDMLPMQKYRAHNWQCFEDLESRQPYASIYTSLGCPYKCSFCCINAPFGVNRYRMRSPEAVVNEVDFLYNRYGV
ncbi:MAG TPA: cobalamin-dependent protein, partial [Terriglobia bacterium]|nr:cobalamin-dependent protein [Terriglobia bacterium]